MKIDPKPDFEEVKAEESRPAATTLPASIRRYLDQKTEAREETAHRRQQWKSGEYGGIRLGNGRTGFLL